MKICKGIYWVGSGAVGLSEPGDCHTYVIEGSNCIALVDCGMAVKPEKIVNNMINDGLDMGKLRYVFLTHAHPDHAGSCQYFKDVYGAKIICSEYEGQVLSKGPVDFFKLAGDSRHLDQWRNMSKCEPDIVIDDGFVLDMGEIVVEAILTPGHTTGSICYLAKISGKNMLFSGDTVFYKGFISVLSPPFTNLDVYRQGIMKLSVKNVDGLFPGHLMWVLKGGQNFIDTAVNAFREYRLPTIKPFS